MLKHLKYIFFSLLVYSSLNAQPKFHLIEIDNEHILQKIVLSTVGSKSTMLVATDKKFNKKLKFTLNYLEIERGQLLSKKVIELKPIAEEAEERVVYLRKISEDRVLMVSTSDNKKENEIVLRTLSPGGDLIAQSVLSTTAKKAPLHIYVKDNIHISYFDLAAKQQAFHQFNSDLEKLGDFKVRIAGVDEEHNLHSVYFTKGHAYTVVLYDVNQAASLMDKAQMELSKIDLNTGKIAVVSPVKLPKTHLFFHRFFATEKALEVVCLSSPSPNNLSDAVITHLQIDWQTLEHKLTLTQMEALKTLEISSGNPVRFKGVDSRIMMHIKRNPVTKNYTFIMRMASETSTSYQQPQSEGGYKTVYLYQTNFSNGLVFDYDSSLSKIGSMYQVDNGFTFQGSSSRFSWLYDTNADFYQTDFKSDTSKQLLSYVTGVSNVDHVLNLKVKQNGKYLPEKAYQINLDTKGASFFYVRTIEETSPSEFVCVAYIRGKGDQLLVVELE